MSQVLVLSGSAGLELSIPQAAHAERERVLTIAKAVVEVQTQEQALSAISAIKELRQVQRGVEESRESVKAPVLKMGREIDAKAKEFVAPVDSELTRLHRLVQARDARLEAERKEAERKAQEEARKAREEQERLEREARAVALKAKRDEEEAARAAKAHDYQAAIEAATKAEEAAAEQQRLQAEAEKARMATYAPVTVVPSKVEGMHTRQTPDFEVSDALELAVKRPDLVTITANRSAIMRELTKLGKWEGKAVVQDIPGIVAWWNRKAVIS